MHNLCIFKVIESWQLSHNEAKIADLQKSTKRLNNELSLNRLQRMRPQTKININRKETRIFGAVYERVYDEISWILRINDFSYFKAFKVLKNLRFWEFSENSVRSQKFKNQEAWKVKAGKIQFQITFDFWVFNFKRLLSADLASSMNFQTSLTALFVRSLFESTVDFCLNSWR